MAKTKQEKIKGIQEQITLFEAAEGYLKGVMNGKPAIITHKGVESGTRQADRREKPIQSSLCLCRAEK